ncbi:MAG: hypothetical protein AAF846_14795 [Chloroflexota bacterium]
MSIKNLSRLIMVSGLLIAMLLAVSPTFACSPMEGAFDYTLEEQIDDADLIVVGTIVGGEVRNYSGAYEVIETAEIEVEQYLKGTGQTLINVRGFGDGADCNSIVAFDEQYIVFVDILDDGQYVASYMAVHDATMTPNDANINDIVAITGGSSDPQPLSPNEQIARQLDNISTWMFIIGISIMVGAVVSAFWLRGRINNKRKRKSKRSE